MHAVLALCIAPAALHADFIQSIAKNNRDTYSIPHLARFTTLYEPNNENVHGTIYASNSEWRHFRSRTKPTRSDLYIPFMMHYRVVAICIEEW